MIPQSQAKKQAEIERLLELPAYLALPHLRLIGRTFLKSSNSPLTLVQHDRVAPLFIEKPVLGDPPKAGAKPLGHEVPRLGGLSSPPFGGAGVDNSSTS
jgi:hypothetical protein